MTREATKYEQADQNVHNVAESLINKFFGRFSHFSLHDLHLVFKDSETSTEPAKIRLLRGFYQSLTKKKVGIEIWKKGWEEADEDEKALILYKKLRYIQYDSENNKYSLRKHEIKSLVDMLRELGLSDEKWREFYHKDKNGK